MGKASAWKVFKDAPDLLEHLREESQISAGVLAKAETFVRVSMGLTDRRKRAKNLADSRKN